MITYPPTEDLIRTVRRELVELVVPAVADPILAVTVQMMAGVLSISAQRVERETLWMREEATEIENAAVALLAARPRADLLADALETYRRALTSGVDPAEARADYNRAGEVLSCAIEEAFAAGGNELLAPFEALLASRLERELEIMGCAIDTAGRH